MNPAKYRIITVYQIARIIITKVYSIVYYNPLKRNSLSTEEEINQFVFEDSIKYRQIRDTE